MTNKANLLVIITLLISISCNLTEKETKINFDNFTNQSVDLNLLKFEGFDLIILETSQESMFYRAEYSFINDNNILIFDYKSGKLLLFDSHGSFNYSFYEEYKKNNSNRNITGVGIIDDTIYAFDNDNQEILKIDKLGHILQTKKMDKFYYSLNIINRRLFLTSLTPFFNNNHLFNLTEFDPNTLNYCGAFVKNKKRNFKKYDGSRFISAYSDGDSIVFWDAYDSMITKICVEGEEHNSYALNLGQKGIPDRIFHNKARFDTEGFDYLFFSYVIEDEDNIYFRGVNNHRGANFIYNKNSESLANIGKGILLSDEVELYFMPWNKTEKNSLYSFYEFSALKEIISRELKSVTDPQLKELLNKDILTNPVLIILRNQ